LGSYGLSTIKGQEGAAPENRTSKIENPKSKMARSADGQTLARPYSNSEQDMKYPQRGQIILQR
jgi:hypothetical protein